ncbi:ABC transporter G family member 23-like [Folsomia candida]|uniref:ABC transporter G family member 23-like n=1 Tax=Folsomia candida TaxID=158441 RepID=UPI001604A514|nr:ABC transporter G family member 23-like [Folsomia candida]XP_035706108.1 ABC transporter G family member 23-like [Folsomia candida]
MEEHFKKCGAINVVNVSKGYGSRHNQTVLNRLNLSVESGSIYGLLGSSGCGKTTLLSCIIGLHKPDNGHILLFGKEVNGVAGQVVGFMPQDVGLYDSFTIEETFVYFANMYNISYAILNERLAALQDLLSIPKLSSPIKSLSGGEKRRVSLAVTLIHRPKLLVYDEPTVSLDPLLRVKIWGYLTKLVKSDGITILVTTHYTQEALHCDKIGILRNGRLLVEENPQVLLDKFNTNLLENVVLDLCRKDEVSDSDQNNGAMLMKTEADHEQAHNDALTYDLARHMDLCDVEVVGIGQNSLKDSGTDSFSSKLTKIKGLVKRNWINELRHFQLVVILIAIPFINVLLGVYVIGLEQKVYNWG